MTKTNFSACCDNQWRGVDPFDMDHQLDKVERWGDKIQFRDAQSNTKHSTECWQESPRLPSNTRWLELPANRAISRLNWRKRKANWWWRLLRVNKIHWQEHQRFSDATSSCWTREKERWNTACQRRLREVQTNGFWSRKSAAACELLKSFYTKSREKESN